MLILHIEISDLFLGVKLEDFYCRPQPALEMIMIISHMRT